MTDVYKELNNIINRCDNDQTNQIEITLPDNSFGKQVFLALSDETYYCGRLNRWTLSLYDNNKMGKRCVENNIGVRKHLLIRS